MGKHKNRRRALRLLRDQARFTRPADEQWRLLTDDPAPTASFAREVLLTAVLGHQQRHPLSSLSVGVVASLPRPLLAEVGEALLLEYVGANWSGGWQPAELLRQARLGCSASAAARLAGWAIASDHVNRRSTTLDHRWVEQIDALGLPAASGRPGWLDGWATAEDFEWSVVVEVVVDLLANFSSLPSLEPILPPPGSAATDRQSWRSTSGAANDPILERIRNLLAKAESTPYEAEALAFTAKAHELMTRHAIDALAVNSRQRTSDDRPIVRRVFIDAPYVEVKSYLLQVVAEAGRCRAFLYTGLSLSTVVGFADDIAAVEVLFTSLLLQAQNSLSQASSVAPAGARPRSKAFRSAFLTGFTHRIAERLRQVNEAVMAEAEAHHGASLVPLLQSRQDDLDQFVADQFELVTRSRNRRAIDGAGYLSGQAAADRAQLNDGYLVGSV